MKPIVAYTTGQVAKLTGVSVATLMKWEKWGVFLEPERMGALRIRLWTDAHIADILTEKEQPRPQNLT